jgi:hypothetical protein
VCGVCLGTSQHDNGVPVPNTGTTQGQSWVDCNGDCFGSAYINGCGYCVEGNTGITDVNDFEGTQWEFEYGRDCSNYCDGDSVLDNPCGDGQCNDNGAPGPQVCCESIAFVDDCGVCSDGLFYNTETSTLEPVNHASNSDKDCSGQCFGYADFSGEYVNNDIQLGDFVCCDLNQDNLFIDGCGFCLNSDDGDFDAMYEDCAGTCPYDDHGNHLNLSFDYIGSYVHVDISAGIYNHSSHPYWENNGVDICETCGGYNENCTGCMEQYSPNFGSVVNGPGPVMVQCGSTEDYSEVGPCCDVVIWDNTNYLYDGGEVQEPITVTLNVTQDEITSGLDIKCRLFYALSNLESEEGGEEPGPHGYIYNPNPGLYNFDDWNAVVVNNCNGLNPQYGTVNTIPFDETIES